MRGVGVAIGLMVTASVVGCTGGEKGPRDATNGGMPGQGTETPDTPLSGPVAVNLEDVQWTPGPDALPQGAQIAMLEGVPSAEGKTFTMLLKLPQGYTIAPHRHVVNERVTVLSGSVDMGMGKEMDRSQAMRLEQGSINLLPGGEYHYVLTTDDAVVQVQGLGPFVVVYANPADDPRLQPQGQQGQTGKQGQAEQGPPPRASSTPFESGLEARMITPNDVPFQDAPRGLLPQGAQMAVLEGETPPTDARTFTVRLKVPDGYRFMPHAHARTDRLTILSGSMMVGLGGTWNEAELRELRPGATAIAPASTPHYGVARGETVVQLWGIGPLDFKWVSPADAPSAQQGSQMR